MITFDVDLLLWDYEKGNEWYIEKKNGERELLICVGLPTKEHLLIQFPAYCTGKVDDRTKWIWYTLEIGYELSSKSLTMKSVSSLQKRCGDKLASCNINIQGIEGFGTENPSRAENFTKEVEFRDEGTIIEISNSSNPKTGYALPIGKKEGKTLFLASSHKLYIKLVDDTLVFTAPHSQRVNNPFRYSRILLRTAPLISNKSYFLKSTTSDKSLSCTWVIKSEDH